MCLCCFSWVPRFCMFSQGNQLYPLSCSMNIYKAKAVGNLLYLFMLFLMGAKSGAEVLHFLTGESVIFLIMFNEFLQVQAVANLITEIHICLCHFLWVPSWVPRHG